MFTTFIVQPIFNILVAIYALLPGHDFGVTIIIFTIIARLAMWPLVKKQLHHAKAMRELAPEIKRIKKEAKGNRQQESMMTMALYKEKEINPFASIGLLIVQIPIIIAMYSCINRIVNDPSTIASFSYPFLQGFDAVKAIAANPASFDGSFLGVIDLTRSALVSGGGIYWPAMMLVIGSAVTQYYQSKQLMPTDKEARKLKDILRAAGNGKQADQTEINAAVGRSTRYFIPAMIFIFTVNLPSALSLYWFATGLVAIIQQGRILGREEQKLEKAATTTTVTRSTAKSRADKAQEAVVVKSAPKKRKSTKKGKRK